jgi:hypothetical protein
MYKDHVVVSMRQDGLRQLVVYDVMSTGAGFAVGNERIIKFDEDAYALRGGGGEYKYGATGAAKFIQPICRFFICF